MEILFSHRIRLNFYSYINCKNTHIYSLPTDIPDSILIIHFYNTPLYEMLKHWPDIGKDVGLLRSKLRALNRFRHELYGDTENAINDYNFINKI